MDNISLAARLESRERILARCFADWRVMDPEEWATRVRRMPDSNGATRPFSFEYAPYQREMYAELFNPRNQEVVFQLFSRGGKSEVVQNALGYTIHQRPCRIGVMWPTLGQGKKWSKDDFMESLVIPTAELSELIGDDSGRRKSDNTLLHKIFAGGLIDIVGANAPGDLRRMKARFLYGDEIDAIVEIGSDEGDQLAIFKKRGSEFSDTIEVYASYPSLKRRSRIEAKELETDGRRWPVPCLSCGFEDWIMHRRDLRYDRDKPEGALLECPNCHHFHNDAARYKMSRQPEKWKATRPFRGKAGFQANALLWPHPVDPRKFPGGFLQMLAQQEIDAGKSDNPERSRRVLVNTVDAETYEAEYEHKPEHTALFLRREEYDPRVMLPAGVLAIFFFVDVQADRLELFVDGYGLRNQIWALDYQVIKGTPLAPPDQGCWAEIDRILSTTRYPHPSGKYLPLLGGESKNNGGLFDCAYKPDNVFAFTRSRARYRIFASRGATTLNKPIIQRRPKREGNPATKVWELGTNEAKDIIYQRLELDNREANGYQHFPKLGQFSEQYFAMLVAEDSEMKRAGDGKFYRAFSCDNGTRNEALDGRVGTMAAERICRPNYKKLAAEMSAKDQSAANESSIDGTTAEVEGKASEVKQTRPPVKRFVRSARPFNRPGGFVGGWRR